MDNLDALYIKPPMKNGLMHYSDGSVGPYRADIPQYNPDMLSRQIMPFTTSADPYEIVALSVVSSLGRQIMLAFPGVPWHRESISVNLLTFPNFFINQLTLDAQPERHNHWWINYLGTIRYRHIDDPGLSWDLQEQLDRVSLTMMDKLTDIYWNDIPVMIRNPRTEKVDGVLHYFCNITVMATKPIEEVAKMMTLEINKEVI